MRERLLGYLLDALEPEERQEVEDALERDPNLQHELELLSDSLEPLRAAEGDVEPPTCLAERTCKWVIQRAAALSRAAVGSAEPVDHREALMVGNNSGRGNRWTFTDLAVAAGIFFAAALLFFPAIQKSRAAAHKASCQNNLRNIGQALAKYSELHDRYLPPIAERGNLGTAGVVLVLLKHDGYFSRAAPSICPSSDLAEKPELARLPTIEELQAARGRDLHQMLKTMGGSYGYYLGHMQDGVYRRVRSRNRPGYALMSDAPSLHLEGLRSANHGGLGQNVLYEDGHVGFQTECSARGCDDHLFTNNENQIAAGCDANDVVIARSESRPFAQPVMLLNQ